MRITRRVTFGSDRLASGHVSRLRYTRNRRETCSDRRLRCVISHTPYCSTETYYVANPPRSGTDGRRAGFLFYYIDRNLRKRIESGTTCFGRRPYTVVGVGPSRGPWTRVNENTDDPAAEGWPRHRFRGQLQLPGDTAKWPSRATLHDTYRRGRLSAPCTAGPNVVRYVPHV